MAGKSLFLFGPDNRFRIIIARVVDSPYFDFTILVFIIISSILLAIENPLHDPDSALMQLIYKLDICMTTVFALEAVLKIIAYGFLFNGRKSYLRIPWNLIDFIIVLFSVVSLSLTNNKLKIVKVLRLLRVLRPLRVISRNEGLKVAV